MSNSGGGKEGEENMKKTRLERIKFSENSRRRRQSRKTHEEKTARSDKNNKRQTD